MAHTFVCVTSSGTIVEPAFAGASISKFGKVQHLPKEKNKMDEANQDSLGVACRSWEHLEEEAGTPRFGQCLEARREAELRESKPVP